VKTHPFAWLFSIINLFIKTYGCGVGILIEVKLLNIRFHFVMKSL